MNYFNMTGRKFAVNPKFILYSAHAETVAPLLRLYRLETTIPFTPLAAFAMMFDFIETDGQINVHLQAANGGDSYVDLLKMEIGRFEQITGMQLLTYSHNMGSSDMKEVCKMPF